MTVFDRYLLKSFIKIFLISFVSFSGLFVVIHLFTNLDELQELADKTGGLGPLVVDFYGPRLLDLFNRTAGVLVLVSAIFAVSMMQRRGELTAILAAGIPKSRVVRPIIFAAIVMIGLSIANRELVIPKIKDKLVRTPKNWTDDGSVDMKFQKDHLTGLLIRGDQLMLKENKITETDIQLPMHMSSKIPRLHSQWSTIEPAKEWRPAGILMHQVTEPENLSELSSMATDDQTVVYAPRDHKWLRPRQVFVAVELNANEIAFGKQLAQYSTLQEMMATLRKPRLWFGHGQQIEVHSRILHPLLDLTLLLLGLPLVISRPDRNIFMAAGSAVLVIVAFSVVVMVCQALGSYSLLRPASFAAWLPLIVFVPLAALSMRKLKN